MAQEWQLPAATDRCAADGRVFAPGEVVRAYLFAETGGFARRDYCLACRPADETGLVGAWTRRRPSAASEKPAAFDAEAAFKYFRRLGDDDAAERQQFRFVLALLLWRKKLLKLAETAGRGEKELWLFRSPRTEESFEVTRPDLSEDEIEHLGGQLEALLAGVDPGQPDAPTGTAHVSQAHESNA